MPRQFDHAVALLIVLAMSLGAYVGLTLAGHGDAAVDLRLPIVGLIGAAAGASRG